MLLFEHPSDTHTRIVIQHNQACSRPLMQKIITGFSMWFLLMFLVCLQFNAWPVMIFAFLSILAVTLSFQYSLQQAANHEQMTLQPPQLVWEEKKDGQYRRHTFVSDWLKVEAAFATNGDCEQLILSASGKRLTIAQHATYAERAQLYQFLKSNIGQAR